MPLVISYGLMALLAFWFFRKGKQGVGNKGNFTFKAIMSLFWYSLGVITSLLLAALVPMIPQHYENAVTSLEYYGALGEEMESQFKEKSSTQNSQNPKSQFND